MTPRLSVVYKSSEQIILYFVFDQGYARFERVPFKEKTLVMRVHSLWL